MAKENKVLFKAGTELYDADEVASRIYNNLDPYMKFHNYSKKDREKARQAMGHFINGIRRHGVYIDESGNTVDPNGRLANIEGIDLVTGFVNNMLREGLAQGIIKKYEEPKPKEFDGNLTNHIASNWFADKDLDSLTADDINAFRKRGKDVNVKHASTLMKELADKIESGEMTAKEGYNVQSLRALSDALADGKIDDNEEALFNSAGFDWNAAKTLFSDEDVVDNTWEKDRRNALKAEGYTPELIERQINAERQNRTDKIDLTASDTESLHTDYLNTLANKDHDKKWEEYRQRYKSNIANKSYDLGEAYYKDSASYKRNIATNNFNPQLLLKTWLSNPEGYTTTKSGTHKNKLFLSNYLSHLVREKDNSLLLDIGDGRYVIKDSINYDNGTALVYKDNKLQEIDAGSGGDVFRDMLKLKWYQDNPYTTSISSIPWKKEGGIFKFQQGGSIEELLQAAVQSGLMTPELALLLYAQYITSQLLSSGYTPYTPGLYFTGPSHDIMAEAQALIEADKKAEQADLEAKAKEAGKTVELYLAGKKHLRNEKGELDFSDLDWLRLGAMAADVVGLVSSFVPGYGTAVSGGAGLTSMGLNLAADIADESMSGWDVAKNIGLNLGTAALGLIPGGKAAGLAGKVAKYVPKILAYSSAGMIMLDPEVLKSLEKCTKSGKENELTVNDWKNISMALGAITGLTRSATAAMKTHAIKSQATATTGETTHTIKTTKGEVKLNDSQFLTLLSKGSQDEKNAFLGTLFKSDGKTPLLASDEKIQFKRDKSWYNPMTWRNGLLGGMSVTTTKGGTTYDLSNVLGFGDINNKFSDINILGGNINRTFGENARGWNPYNWGKQLGTTNTSTASGVAVNPTSTPINGLLRQLPLNGNKLTSAGRQAVNQVIFDPTIPRQNNLYVLRPGVEKLTLQQLQQYYPNLTFNNFHVAYKGPQGGILWWKQGGKLQAIEKLKSLKQGGTVQLFETGGTPLNNVNFSNGNGRSNWRPEIFNYIQLDIKNKFTNKSDEELADYVNWLNNMQSRHAKLYQTAGSDFQKKTGYNLDVYDYQNDYDNDVNAGYNSGEMKNAISQAYRRGRYTPVGGTRRTSGDSPEGFKNDGLYGAITDDRRILGRISADGTDDWDENSLSQFNEHLGKRGYEMYLDDTDKYYKIRKKEQSDNVSGNPSTIAPRDGSRGESWLNKGLQVFNHINPAKALELANYLEHLRSNKAIYDKQRASLRPSYKSFMNAHDHVIGDLVGLQLYNTQAAKVMTMVGRGKTSDAAGLLAGQLAGFDKASDLHILGNKIYNDMLYKTAEANTALLHKINEYNTGVKDNNDSVESSYAKALGDLWSQWKAQNTLNKDNFIKGNIYDYKTKDVNEKNFHDEMIKFNALNRLSSDPELKAMYKEYESLYSSSNKEDLERAKELKTKIENKQSELANSIQSEMYSKIAQNHGYKLPLFLPLTYLYRKKGGSIDTSARRVRTADNREFQKNIQNGVKNHQHLVDNLSKSTLLAIKRALGI